METSGGSTDGGIKGNAVHVSPREKGLGGENVRKGRELEEL